MPSPSQPRTDRAADAEESRRSAALARLAATMFAGGLIIVCVLCAGSLYWFRPDVVDDPDAAAAVTEQMLEIDIPEGFQPRGVIDWNVAFLVSLRGAYYERAAPQSEGTLTFVEVQSLSMDKPEVREHLRSALLEPGEEAVELPVEESETRELTVRGEPVPFTFETRRDPAGDAAYRVIEGVVEGRRGPVLIIVRVAVDDGWDDAAVVNMIESIR